MEKFLIFMISLISVLSAMPLHAQQHTGSKVFSHPWLNKFGYNLSLNNNFIFDSNIMKRNPVQKDYGGLFFPSFKLFYPVSRSTMISAEYLFGTNRMISTSILNTVSHTAFLRLYGTLNPHLKVQVYGDFKKSSQPDILNMSTRYAFATYFQNREGIKLNWTKTPATSFSIDFNTHQRSYRTLNTSSSSRQKDFLNSLELSGIHAFTDQTLGFIQIGYCSNASNSPVYRYFESYLKTFVSHTLSGGIKIEMLQKIGNLRFSERAVSNNPSLNRNDLIIETTFGMRKRINSVVSINTRYCFLKDFSNEPFRKINAHTVIFGLDLSLKKGPSSITKSSDYAHHYDSSGYPAGEELQPEVLTNIGYECILRGRYDDSIRFSLKAISIDPTIKEAHINLGIAYYKKGRLADAIREWETALKLDPTNSKVRTLVEKARAEEENRNK